MESYARGQYRDSISIEPETPLSPKLSLGGGFAEGRFRLDGDASLGSGATSKVYRVSDCCEPFEPKAAKIVPKGLSAAWEVNMFRTASDRLNDAPFVPKLYGAYDVDEGRRTAIVMTLLRPLGIDDVGKERYARGMRACVDALHEVGIAHGDVHLGNFMIDSATDRVCIIDFGLSYDHLKPTEWFAPPIPRGKRYDELDWTWLAASSSTKDADFMADEIKLEATLSSRNRNTKKMDFFTG